MDIIINWIQVKPTLKDFFIIASVSIVSMHVWCFLLGNAFLKMNWIEEEKRFNTFGENIIFSFLEENLSRLIPIMITMEIWGFGKMLFLVIILSSFIFGIVHGYFACIFLQGIWGIVFSVIFLKFGGLYQEYITAWISVSIIHSVYNMPVNYFKKRAYG
jgi:hypothetical protein